MEVQRRITVEEVTPISMKSLVEAGVHFGHLTRRWNPKMKPYIYGARNKVYIIDLRKTLVCFQRAYEFVADTVAMGKPVLFVGTKAQAQAIIREQATRAKQFYIDHRWLGGMLTNFTTIKQSIDRLKDLERMKDDGTFLRIPKKEILQREREREKLERNLGGIKNMNSLPGCVFIVDTHKEHIAVAEANRLKIPVVGIVDTNADPDKISFVIPGNDDAIKSIRLFTTSIADACLAGVVRRRERGTYDRRPDTAAHTQYEDGIKVVVRRHREKPKAETTT